MPVTFRAASADSNSATQPQTSLAISLPSGTLDGDFLIAAIAMPAGSATTITAPDGWTLYRKRDQSTTLSLATFIKFAASEPSQWVWTFSGVPQNYSGVAVAYAGVDYWVPVDYEGGNTANAASIATPSFVTSVPNTEAVFFYAAATSSATSVPTGLSAARKTTSHTKGSSVAAYDLAIADSTTENGFTSSIVDGATSWACAVMVLRSDETTATAQQVQSEIQALFPPGDGDLYDWDNTSSDIWAFERAQADYLKRYGFDLRDLWAREMLPSQSVYLLPEREAAMGISALQSAEIGSTLAQRQGAIISKWREGGTATLANIRAVLEPILGYDKTGNSGTLQILECRRAAFTALHTYSDFSSTSLGASATATRTIAVADDSFVSQSGAQVRIVVTSTNPEQLSATLTGPAVSASTGQTGLMTTTTGNKTFTGSGTRFTVALSPGTQVTVDSGATWNTVATVTSDTSGTFAAGATATATNAGYSTRTRQASVSWAAGSLPAGAVTQGTFVLSDVTSSRNSTIFGNWTFTLTTGAASATLHSCSLFVEGQGRDSAGNDGLGAGAFYWVAVVDVTKTKNPDYVALANAIKRIRPAFGPGTFTRLAASYMPSIPATVGLGAIPSTTNQSANMIPNRFVPSFGAWIPWAPSYPNALPNWQPTSPASPIAATHPACAGYFTTGHLF